MGIYFFNNSDRLFHVHEHISKFYGSVHSFLTCCNVNRELVLLEFLKSKCASKLFYGLDQWRRYGWACRALAHPF